MALCRIGGMTSPDDHESVNNINVLIGLLRDKGETDKARAILDHFEKHQELLKRKGNDPGKKKPWWKR